MDCNYEIELRYTDLESLGSAGIAELMVFHPVRATLPKRLNSPFELPILTLQQGRYYCEAIDEQPG